MKFWVVFIYSKKIRLIAFDVDLHNIFGFHSGVGI